MNVDNCDLKINTNINTNNVREYEDLDCSAQYNQKSSLITTCRAVCIVEVNTGLYLFQRNP